MTTDDTPSEPADSTTPTESTPPAAGNPGLTPEPRSRWVAGDAAWAAVTAQVRPGSRLDRMAQPRSRDVVRELAEQLGICTRPLPLRQVERATGRIESTYCVPCDARLASKCRPCAERNRKLRVRQIREGWHLREEPTVIPEKPTAEVVGLLHLRAEFLFMRDECERAAQWDQVAYVDEAISLLDEDLAGQRLRGSLDKPKDPRNPETVTKRRVRSTRRRVDAGKLPNRKVENRSIGRLYYSRDGSKSYNHSLLVTHTLPSFGPVHGRLVRNGQPVACRCGQRHDQDDPAVGTPLEPQTYDYRGQALAAIGFPLVLERFWQNLRRKVGYKVAYAGCVEMQKRLAPHAHYAVRGTEPKQLIRDITAETYEQVWWPPFDPDHPAYRLDRPPVWDEKTQAYVDPDSGQQLRTWDEAVDGLTEPAFVARLGMVDVRGIREGVSKTAKQKVDKTIGYITKYITKDLVDQTFIDGDVKREHFRRLYAELSVLPCSPRCANWLLYGVQPQGAKKGQPPREGLVPGGCRGKVHQPATLGYTGRRALVSRNWSNKTLSDHDLDGRAWHRAVTTGQLSDESTVDGHQDKRFYVEVARPDDLDVPSRLDWIMRTIHARTQAQQAIQTARDRDKQANQHVPATGVEYREAA